MFKKSILLVGLVMICFSCAKTDQQLNKELAFELEDGTKLIPTIDTLKADYSVELPTNDYEDLLSFGDNLILANNKGTKKVQWYTLKDKELQFVADALEEGKGPAECTSCGNFFTNGKDSLYQYDFSLMRVNVFYLNQEEQLLEYKNSYDMHKSNAVYDVELFDDSSFISNALVTNYPFFISDRSGKITHNVGAFYEEATEDDVPNYFGQVHFGYFSYNKDLKKVVKAYFRESRLEISDLSNLDDVKTQTVLGPIEPVLNYEKVVTDYGPQLAYNHDKPMHYGSSITSSDQSIFTTYQAINELNNKPNKLTNTIIELGWDLKTSRIHYVEDGWHILDIYYNTDLGELHTVQLNKEGSVYLRIYGD